MGKDKLVPALEFFFLSVEPWCVHWISACPCHSSSSHTGLCTVPRPPRITVQWGAVSLLFVWLVSLVWLDCQIEPPWTTQLMVILLVRCSVSGLKSTTAVVYFDSHCLCDQYTPPCLLFSGVKKKTCSHCLQDLPVLRRHVVKTSRLFCVGVPRGARSWPDISLWRTSYSSSSSRVCTWTSSSRGHSINS